MSGMMSKQRRVMDVPHHQAELYAATPVVWYVADVLEAVLKVYGRLIAIVTEGK
jgi:hypothetical protein